MLLALYMLGTQATVCWCLVGDVNISLDRITDCGTHVPKGRPGHIAGCFTLMES